MAIFEISSAQDALWPLKTLIEPAYLLGMQYMPQSVVVIAGEYIRGLLDGTGFVTFAGRTVAI